MSAFVLGFQFLSSVHSFGYYIFDFRRQNQYFKVEFQIRDKSGHLQFLVIVVGC